MKISDFFSPIIRFKFECLVLFILLSTLFYLLFALIPSQSKSTIYFTVKPIATHEGTYNLDPSESAMKTAEMIAGWAKNPAFRQEILTEAKSEISNFKRKISARKQNRTNVFWTIKLTDQEQSQKESITTATVNVIEKNFAAFNKNNSFPFAITTPTVYHDLSAIPKSWIAAISIILALGLTLIIPFVLEMFLGRLSFLLQIKNIFPNSPRLQLRHKANNQENSLMERFILSFESPQLVGTFPRAEELFSLSDENVLLESENTPILLMKLGKTKIRDIENYKAIYGDEVGIIVFE